MSGSCAVAWKEDASNAVEMKWIRALLRRRHDHPDPSHTYISGFYASVRFESMTISRSEKHPRASRQFH